MEVVKIKNPDFSYWAWSIPWGHVLSLKSFCQNPVQSWAIRYSVFQKVKFTSSLSSSGHTIFSTFWHLVVKFGYNKWFLSNKISGVFPFRWNKQIIILSFFTFYIFYIFRNVITNKKNWKNNFFEKTQSKDLFISSKRKNPTYFIA